MLPLRSSFFNTMSLSRLISVGESRSPYFTLLSTLNSTVYALFTFPFAVVFSRVSLISLINLEGIYTGLTNLIFYSCLWNQNMYVIYKYIMNINILFIAFFHNLPYHEYIINCRSFGSKSRLIAT